MSQVAVLAHATGLCCLKRFAVAAPACTGWIHIDLGTDALCYLGDTIQARRPDGTMASKQVSGCGTTWAEAAFKLLCEAAERHAILQSSFGTTGRTTGAFFGLTRDGALARGLLECLERFHFFRCLSGDSRGQRPLRTLTAIGRQVDLVWLNPTRPWGQSRFSASPPCTGSATARQQGWFPSGSPASGPLSGQPRRPDAHRGCSAPR